MESNVPSEHEINNLELREALRKLAEALNALEARVTALEST